MTNEATYSNPNFSSNVQRPTNRSFKLRGVRMTQAQQNAMDRYWGQFGISAETFVTPNQVLPGYDRIVLEIGSGMGEATATMAAADQRSGFLAVELHRPGIGALLIRMEEKNIRNIRIVEEDARVLMREFMPPESVDAVHLYFPDPWPKTKHHKRRIVQSAFIDEVAKVIKPGGYIHIATDWEPYAEWIKELFDASPVFTGGVVPKPDYRPLTKFEDQGLRKGHVVNDLVYKRAVDC